MKKNSIIVCILLLLLVVSSCERTFEKEPLNLLTEEYIWDATDQSGAFAETWVSKIYSRIPTGYSRINGVPLECASDDAIPTNPLNNTSKIVEGGYNPLLTFDDNWVNSYSAIRMANIFLENYEKVPWANQTIKLQRASEARALRAYFYYELVKRYGGVPLIGDKVFKPSDPELFKLKRNSFEECINYIVSELDAVKTTLIPDAPFSQRRTDPNFGRMRPSIALAIKSKTLLLAASPLFNPSSTPQLSYTGYASYNAERWKAAADAAKEVIDLGLFALEADRYTLVTERANNENIFFRMSDSRTEDFYNYYMGPIGYTVNQRNSEGRVSPTQEFVDAFPMKNGKMITDPASGFNPANPYVNRDPRLNQTVFYNGARWLRRAVETFEGGRDMIPPVATLFATRTGYYAKKFCANNDESTAYSKTIYKDNGFTPAWGIIRYADILLMYAEAKNEYSGPDVSVYQAVEQIRTRAGLSPAALPAGLTLAEMRTTIRNERRVELAFEEQRFWDIRRWKIAKTVYGSTLHGVTITKNTNGTFTYTLKEVAKPFFTDAMYLLPIAIKEIQVNPEMQQNPGY
ncbi:RagB/SusD family nutrient uptake outer membrane protein [Desertivirga arenae]|uniref:RagB/SusD family nutrient uptake outer membrane protein n=1 Tax=Desertivirga arenae TaxID=2810309 RepID=UPI001A95E7B6|nr:RagB/SusD family nutrient uptake outer membrane protein [Pedobacter sp. SYSU D00823]